MQLTVSHVGHVCGKEFLNMKVFRFYKLDLFPPPPTKVTKLGTVKMGSIKINKSGQQGWKLQRFWTCPSEVLYCDLLIAILLGLPRSVYKGTFPCDSHRYSFTCPTPFLNVRDRWTVYNFHP